MLELWNDGILDFSRFFMIYRDLMYLPFCDLLLLSYTFFIISSHYIGFNTVHVCKIPRGYIHQGSLQGYIGWNIIQFTSLVIIKNGIPWKSLGGSIVKVVPRDTSFSISVNDTLNQCTACTTNFYHASKFCNVLILNCNLKITEMTKRCKNYP